MKNVIRSVLQQLARGIGCEMIPRWRLANWELSGHLRELFARYRIDCVLDVGANRGQYRDFLRDEVGFEGHIVSFEPMGNLAAVLKERATADSRWRIYHCAVGRAAGTLPLNVMKDDSLSSFRQPEGSHVRDDLDAQNTVVRVEEVAVRTLDELWPTIARELGVSRPYLKMDTQGYDLEVIAGAGAALPLVIALQSEVAFRALYAAAPNYLDSIGQLQAAGFEITSLVPVSRDQELRVIESDCVMVNARHAA